METGQRNEVEEDAKKNHIVDTAITGFGAAEPIGGSEVDVLKSVMKK